MFRKLTCKEGNTKYHNWKPWEHEEVSAEKKTVEQFGNYGGAHSVETTSRGLKVISKRYCSDCNEIEVRTVNK